IAPEAAQLTISGSPAAIRVTRHEELPAALTQHTKTVVIENKSLERIFSMFLFWSAVPILAGLIDCAIVRGYKINASLTHDWKIERTEGKITFTPKSQ